MTTTTLPRIHDLAADQRQAHYDAAQERVRAASREIVAATKARKPDPRSAQDYRGYNTMRLVCVLVATNGRPSTASIGCTRDGTGPRIFLPISRLIAQPESTEEFLLAVIPKWLAEKTGLMGVTSDLVGDWTDAQRETWRVLRDARMSINSKIYSAKKRPASVLSRSAVA
jgi:hypothetical protein